MRHRRRHPDRQQDDDNDNDDNDNDDMMIWKRMPKQAPVVLHSQEHSAHVHLWVVAVDHWNEGMPILHANISRRASIPHCARLLR